MTNDPNSLISLLGSGVATFLLSHLKGCVVEEDCDHTTQSSLETVNTHVAFLYSYQGGVEEEPADPRPCFDLTDTSL